MKRQALFLNHYFIAFFCLLIVALTGCSVFQSVFKLNETSSDCDYVVEECKSDEDVISNSNCYKVYSDLHIYGGSWREVKSMRGVLLEGVKPVQKQKTVYIGDIYDIENAESSDIEEAISNLNTLRQKVGDLYVRGNHEMDTFGNSPAYKKINNILFIHGHHIAWHPDKVRYWESGKMKEFQTGLWKQEYSKKDIINNAVQLAKSKKCNYIVYGHTHPTELITTVKDDVTVINVRKRCTFLQLNPDE